MKHPVTGRTAPEPRTTGPDDRAPGGELRALTGLRIVAALWVVAFHFHFTELPGVTDVTAVLGPLVTQGALCVDLFFVLSGFVIAHTYLDRLGPRLRLRSAGRFVWARAGRMWPAYLVVFHLFGIWLWVRATQGSDPDIAFQAVQPELGWGPWLRQLLLTQMWDRPFLDGASWVGPTWSISAEWLAYLLFPLTALAFFRLRRLPAAVLGAGAVAAMSPMVVSFLTVGTPYYPFSWLVRVLCGFSAGVLMLLAVRRVRRTARVRRVASVTSSVALAGIVGGLLVGDAAGGGPIGFVTLLFPVLVGALALADRGAARWLGSAPMVHGGRVSYALYLVHIPMFEMLWLALRHGTAGRFDGLLVPGSVSAHLIAAAVLVATVPVAQLLYAFVEQPARGWMRDLPGALVRRRTAEPAGPGPAEDDDRHEEHDRYDSDRARLDPPTLRDLLPSLPRQQRPVEPVPALVRLHTAREAGHGDDRNGDGLAGNLLAAARLRSTADARPGRAEEIRRVAAVPATTVAERIPAPAPVSDPEPAPDDVPLPRAGRSGSRSGAERCGRSNSRHRAHGSAATPIVATAAASARGRRRPSHGQHHRRDQ